MRLFSNISKHLRLLAKTRVVTSKSDFSTTAVDNKDNVRVGCASGFWGDTPTAAGQLINHGNVDFLVLDYLSEVTMSLLVAAQKKNPELGYTPDFISWAVGPYVKQIKEKGIRVVTNAGGINPEGCAAAFRQVAEKANVDLKIATVTGDNLMKSDLTDVSAKLSGKSLPKNIHSMNAYLGAGPILQALDAGADIVITGRCVDSALVLGPLMHCFKWDVDDYDKLAAGSLAGHLIECGAQCTGGNFTDWQKVDEWDNMGFPIADCLSSGMFTITKPDKTGGLVRVPTVGEQLVYEIGDPANYELPDVVCDFRHVVLENVQNGVSVKGVRGRPPSNDYKVTATYVDGFRGTAACVVGGLRAVHKARRTAEAILKRSRRLFQQLGMNDFSRVHVQCLGAEETYGTNANIVKGGPREIVMWLAVEHKDKRALDVWAREIASAATGMAPGLCNIIGGRPKPTPVLKHFSFFYPKHKFNVEVHTEGVLATYSSPKSISNAIPHETETVTNEPLVTGSFSYILEDLAYARSGDKGDTCNIGVIARHPSYIPYLRAALTPEAVAEYFAHCFDSQNKRVTRYELPGIHAFNFVLEGSLGGGGIASLRPDPQGKAYAQMLLSFPLINMPTLEELCD